MAAQHKLIVFVVVNAQTNDVYLLVEDIDLHPAFETLQYLADFQHATESERGTRFASLDGSKFLMFFMLCYTLA